MWRTTFFCVFCWICSYRILFSKSELLPIFYRLALHFTTRHSVLRRILTNTLYYTIYQYILTNISIINSEIYPINTNQDRETKTIPKNIYLVALIFVFCFIPLCIFIRIHIFIIFIKTYFAKLCWLFLYSFCFKIILKWT